MKFLAILCVLFIFIILILMIKILLDKARKLEAQNEVYKNLKVVDEKDYKTISDNDLDQSIRDKLKSPNT